MESCRAWGGATGSALAAFVWGGMSAAQAPGPARDARVAAAMHVHIESPQPVELDALDADGEWLRQCTSPCDRDVRVSDGYRITGDGIRDSSTFQLDPGNQVHLTVDPTSSGGHTGAVALTVVSSVALVPVVGVTAVLVASEVIATILICPFAAAGETVKSQQGAEYTGCLGAIGTFFGQAYASPYVWVPGLAGAVGLSAGIVWLIDTPPTKVGMVLPARSASIPGPTPVTVDGFTSKLPPTLTFPAVTLVF